MKGARLGQHFLIHSWAARTLAHAVEPRPGEVIVEVGPGKGVLTRELLTLGEVIAIEKDEALVALLQETFAEEVTTGRLTIVSGDIRNVTPETLGVSKYIVAANIPYYITGEIIRQFLTARVKPRAMALLIQKEVAQRITNGKESILSLSVKAFGTPKIIAKVSKSHFSPPPSVDSAILAVTDISGDFFDAVPEEHFFTVVRAGFASKRKFVANNLSVAFDRSAVVAAMNAAGVSERARAEDIDLPGWRTIAEKLLARS